MHAVNSTAILEFIYINQVLNHFCTLIIYTYLLKTFIEKDYLAISNSSRWEIWNHVCIETILDQSTGQCKRESRGCEGCLRGCLFTRDYSLWAYNITVRRGKLSDLKDFKADAKSRLKANIIASLAEKKKWDILFPEHEAWTLHPQFWYVIRTRVNRKRLAQIAIKYSRLLGKFKWQSWTLAILRGKFKSYSANATLWV